MFKLVRNPYNPKDVYAINEGVRHLITNKQSLLLGSQGKGKLWIWEEGREIPVATWEEWYKTIEGFEICLLPRDASLGQKFGANLRILIKNILNWLRRK